MLLGIEDAKKIEGYFNEYQYQTIVTRKPSSENFGCFKDNDLLFKVIVSYIYCRDDQDYANMIGYWNSKCVGVLDMYKYIPMQRVNRKLYMAFEAVQEHYLRCNYKYTISFNQNGSREFIH